MYVYLCLYREVDQAVGGRWTMTSSWRWQRWAKAPRNDDNILLNSTTDSRCNLFLLRPLQQPLLQLALQQYQSCTVKSENWLRRLPKSSLQPVARIAYAVQSTLQRVAATMSLPIFSCINYTVADPKLMIGWAPAKSVSQYQDMPPDAENLWKLHLPNLQWNMW